MTPEEEYEKWEVADPTFVKALRTVLLEPLKTEQIGLGTITSGLLIRLQTDNES